MKDPIRLGDAVSQGRLTGGEARSTELRSGRWSEAGEGRIAFFFWLILAVLVVAAGVQWIPVRISADRYQDFLVETAEKRSHRPKNAIEKGLLEKAEELGLPVAKEDIDVSVSSKRIRLHVEYMVPINFMVYTYEWHKEHDVNREIFRF